VFADLAPIQPIELGVSYEGSFSATGAALASFTVDEQYDEVMVVLEHLNYYIGGTYVMVESCGYVPSDNHYDQAAISLGAFRKAIKLTGSQVLPNTTYYLLLTAEY